MTPLDLMCMLPIVIADAALLLTVLRQRRKFAYGHGPADRQEQPMHTTTVPTPAPNDSAITASGTTATSSVVAPTRSSGMQFRDRCGSAISEVLQEAGVSFHAYSPTAGSHARPIIGPRTLTFLLVLSRATDLDKTLSLSDEMAMRANVRHARIGRILGAIAVEFELPAGRWSDLSLEKPGAGMHMRLGTNTLNMPTRLDLSEATTPHVLIAGKTGAGKTVLMSSMLYQSALADPSVQQLLIIDGKQELEAFDRLPHLVAPRLVSGEDITRGLAWAASEVMRRGDLSPSERTPLTVAIDELILLTALGNSAIAPLLEILRFGRSRNVHVVAGTQEVTKEALGNGQITKNFARIAGYVSTAADSVLVTGASGLGADHLTGKGDFLKVTPDGCTRFTAAIVPEDNVRLLPRVETVFDRTRGATIEIASHFDPKNQPVAPSATTPAQFSAVLSDWVKSGYKEPGIGRVKELVKDPSGKSVGTARAQRIREEAAELAMALQDAGIELRIRKSSP